MKIAFLTPEYPHPTIGHTGGIGTSILSLSKALSKLGHDISILVYGQDEDNYFIEENIHFYRIKNIKVKGLSLIFTQKKVERLINTLYKSKKIEIVEAPDWTGFTAFVNPKCPLVIREHGSDTYFCHLDNRKVKYKNKFLETRALINADGIISVSEFTGNLTNRLFKLNRKFTVIPNCINTEVFTSETKSIKNDNPIILYFGTLIRKKGLLELPLSFNKVIETIPNAKLVLIGKDASDIATGNNSTWELMKPLFSKKAIAKVSYLGGVNYVTIKEHIEMADICTFPSFAEALPVSWLEAMAMQKAIVASNIGWASEVIDDGENGFLVHPTNHILFAEKICELLNDDTKRRQFGIAAKAKIDTHFDRKVVAEKSLKFYKSILGL